MRFCIQSIYYSQWNTCWKNPQNILQRNQAAAAAKNPHIINDCSKKSENILYEFNLIASKALFVHKRKNPKKIRWDTITIFLYL